MNISKIGFSGNYCLPVKNTAQAEKASQYANDYCCSGLNCHEHNIKKTNAYAEGTKVFINTSERQFSPLDKTMLYNTCRYAGVDRASVRESFQHYAMQNGLIVTHTDRQEKYFSCQDPKEQV